MSRASDALLLAKAICRDHAANIIERLHIAYCAQGVWSRETGIRALEECDRAAGQMKDSIAKALAEARAEVR
jgi:hypothetical protein